MKRHLDGLKLSANKRFVNTHEARCHQLLTIEQPLEAIKQELEKQKERLCFDCYATAFKCGGWDYLRKILALDPERPGEVRDSDGRSLLMITTTSEQFHHLLITCKVSPYVVSPAEGNCLTYATRKQIVTLDLLEELLSRGVDVNVVDRQGMSSLMYAAMLYDDPKYMKLLLDAGGDARAVDAEGNTLLMQLFNIKTGFTNKFLCEKFDLLFDVCDVEVRNKSNESLSFLAGRQCSYHALPLSYVLFKLIEKAGDVNLIVSPRRESVLFSIARNCKVSELMHKIIDFAAAKLVNRMGLSLFLNIVFSSKDLSVLSHVIDAIVTRFLDEPLLALCHPIFCMVAKSCGSAALVHRILDVFSDKLVADRYKLWLTVAEHCRDTSVLLRLLDLMEPSVANERGDNVPNILAFRSNDISPAVLDKLIKTRDENFKNSAGENAMMIIARVCTQPSILAKIVLETNQRIRNRDGWNVLMLVAKHCKNEAVLQKVLSTVDFETEDALLKVIVDHCELPSILLATVHRVIENLEGRAAEEILIQVSKQCRHTYVLHKVLRDGRLDIADKNGANLLMLMTQNTENVSVLDTILNVAEYRNIDGERERLFLILAEFCHCIRIIEKMSKMCDVNAQNETGATAVMLMARRLCNQRFALKKDSFHNTFKESVLLDVDLNAYGQTLAIFKYLMSVCNVNLKNKLGDNLLLFAIKNVFKARVFHLTSTPKAEEAALISKVKDFYGEKHLSLIQLLLGTCQLHVRNTAGQNALMLVAEHFSGDRCLELVREMLRRGLSVQEVDCQGNNVLHYAARNKSQRSPLVKFFLARGASAVQKNKAGATFLHLLARKHFRLLHENIKSFEGAMFLLEDGNRCTALTLVVLQLIRSPSLEHSNDLETMSDLVSILFTMAASATTDFKLNCEGKMHPAYLLFEAMLRNFSGDIKRFAPVLEAVLLSPFKDVDICVPYDGIHHQNREVYFRKCVSQTCTFNAVASVTQYYMAAFQGDKDPMDLIVKMLNSGYTVMAQSVISPLSILLHHFCYPACVSRMPENTVMLLLDVFVECGADVNQRVADFGRPVDLEVPDAVWLAANAGFAECVEFLLPHWSAPSMCLLSVCKDPDTAARLYLALKEFGPLPLGYDKFDQISELMQFTEVYQDFAALHNSRPRTLMDYSRAVIRTSLNARTLPAGISQLKLPTKIEDYLLYK